MLNLSIKHTILPTVNDVSRMA